MTPLATKSNEPIPGYCLKQRIGAGGYGEVWSVEAPGQLLKAIKFVYGMLDEDRAARELKALNRIKGVRHPFLLSLERIEVVDGQLVIITELAEGSLKDRYEECRKHGDPGIGREELICHLRDAADALDYMNEHNSLQHLDVKPENLLLVGGRVKVADFGLVKDIQDAAASMMGGLTPVYAPPEVFEGSPSRRSDQYSLAIVFQEMLTGVLPFPGKTAAQLAAQHLNAKPRLSSLPAGDQPIIARALAKKPADRFASCRELINLLENAGRTSITAPAGSAAEPGVTQTQGPPSSLAATEAGLGGSNSLNAPAATAPPSRTTGDMLNQLDAASQAAEQAVRAMQSASEMQAAGPVLEAPPPCVDCPPPALAAGPQTHPPTLFIGIGGTGGRVLQKLRQRYRDRTTADGQPPVAMLLLDTDGRDLMRATHGEDGAPLAQEETVAMPLRRSQDYRNDSRQILEWLSRRWLYNIPRSLQTEGLRPLGRLALVDHAELVFRQIQTALQTLRQQSPAQSEQAVEPARAPRVVLVSSLGGGTGSGTAIDVAYIARQILDEMQLGESPVLAVLAHGTNRNPQSQELSAVNTFAALSELNQFHRRGGTFPGDFACGLKPRDSAALQATYVVHLGNDLSAEQYHQACDHLAEFLFLDSATPAAQVLEACRKATGQDDERHTSLNVRTFGLCQIGMAQDPLIEVATSRLCQAVLERWTGQPKPANTTRSTRIIPLPLQGQPSPTDTQAAKDTQLDTVAATHAASLGLDMDRLMQQAYERAAQELDGDADACFRAILRAYPNNEAGPQVARWLSAMADVFGPRPNAEAPPARPTPLQTAMEQQARAMATPIAESARKWLESLVDHPAARLYGAQRAVKWLQNHLKSLGEKLRETRVRLAQEGATAERQLIAATNGDPRTRQKAVASPPGTLEGAFVQTCRLRLFELAAQTAGQIVQALQAHLLGAHDSLIELGRELQSLSACFPAGNDEPPPASDDELAALKSAVAHQLRQHEEPIAGKLDEKLTAGLLVPKGGLRKLLLTGESRRELIDQLHAAARLAILQGIEQLDFAALLLRASTDHGNAAPKLPRLLQAAQPTLQSCGGQRRLICVLPATSNVLPEEAIRAIESEPRIFQETLAVVRESGSDVIFCFEMGQMPLVQVAAAVVDHRPDYVECAGRIHTRADVPWQPLLCLPNG